MATPKLVRKVTGHTLDLDYCSLNSIVEQIKGYQDSLTKSGWIDLKVEMIGEPYDDSGREYPNVVGMRMETMEEAVARETVEAEHAAVRAQRERGEYDRLRAKFSDQ